jgi:WD40 repeat protein
MVTSAGNGTVFVWDISEEVILRPNSLAMVDELLDDLTNTPSAAVPQGAVIEEEDTDDFPTPTKEDLLASARGLTIADDKPVISTSKVGAEPESGPTDERAVDAVQFASNFIHATGIFSDGRRHVCWDGQTGTFYRSLGQLLLEEKMDNQEQRCIPMPSPGFIEQLVISTNLLIAAMSTGKLHVFDRSRLNCIGTLDYHSHSIADIVLAKNESIAVSLGSAPESCVVVWSLPSCSLVAASDLDVPHYGLTLTLNNGREFATAGENGCILWALDLDSGSGARLLRAVVKRPSTVFTCLSRIPTTQYMVAGTSLGDLFVMSFEDGSVVHSAKNVFGNALPISFVQPLDDGNMVVAQSSTLHLVDGDFGVLFRTGQPVFDGVITALSIDKVTRRGLVATSQSLFTVVASASSLESVRIVSSPGAGQVVPISGDVVAVSRRATLGFGQPCIRLFTADFLEEFAEILEDAPYVVGLPAPAKNVMLTVGPTLLKEFSVGEDIQLQRSVAISSGESSPITSAVLLPRPVNLLITGSADGMCSVLDYPSLNKLQGISVHRSRSIVGVFASSTRIPKPFPVVIILADDGSCSVWKVNGRSVELTYSIAVSTLRQESVPSLLAAYLEDVETSTSSVGSETFLVLEFESRRENWSLNTLSLVSSVSQNAPAASLRLQMLQRPDSERAFVSTGDVLFCLGLSQQS